MIKLKEIMHLSDGYVAAAAAAASSFSLSHDKDFISANKKEEHIKQLADECVKELNKSGHSFEYYNKNINDRRFLFSEKNPTGYIIVVDIKYDWKNKTADYKVDCGKTLGKGTTSIDKVLSEINKILEKIPIPKSESLSYRKKQLSRKRRFYLSEDSNNERVKFKLTKSQFDQLDKIANEFGADLEGLVESSITEKEAPNYLGMSSFEMEKKGIILAIDKSILDNLHEFIQTGLDAKGWYSEMNSKIIETFGDSDGCLLLILLAIFSPQNKLAQNLRLASQTYCGIKQDLDSPDTKAKLEEFMELKPSDAYKRIHAGEFRELSTVRGIILGMRNLPSYLSNFLRVLKLYKQKNYTFDKVDVVNEISKHLTSTGGLTKDTIISAEKVFSFTLNLLDPNFQFANGWLPATMDTWMASFFYPNMDKKEKSKLLGNSKNYVYLAKLTQQLAKIYGMLPHEMQAILWVAMIRKKQGPNYDVTFNNAISKNLQRLKIKEDELKNADKFFEKVILSIGCVM